MKGKRIRPIEKVLMAGMVLIMLLVAIPSILHFFENARQNKCFNNLRQLGQALRIYWDDYREVYPPPVDGHGGRYYTGGATALGRYLSSSRTLHCPNDRHRPDVPGYSSYNIWDADGDGKPETFIYNAFGWLENGGTEDLPDGWPSAASPTAEGQVRADLQQAWERIGYRYSQQPYLANGNALLNTIALVCPRHTQRKNPVLLFLRINEEIERAPLSEVDFISQLPPRQEKAEEEK